MKSLTLLLFLMLFWQLGNSQSEHMVNGGFEVYDPNPIPTPPIGLTWLIDYAQGWKALYGSPDLFHPSTLTNPAGGASYSPNTGVGHANFYMHYNGLQEWFYGRTTALTAGQLYQVSYYVKTTDFLNQPIQFGVDITTTIPTAPQLQPYVATSTPEWTSNVSSQYSKVEFCFTATQSGVHYLTFGFFQESPLNIGNFRHFVIDDVSVMDIVGNNPPVANINMPSIFCPNDPIIADGSLSNNETAYIWDLYQINGGLETIVNSGTTQAGQVSTLDVNSLTGFNPTPNTCYRLYLTVLGGCPDKTFTDFCIAEEPNIDFINDGDPVCEGDLIDLTVTGDNAWTYAWFQGSTTSGTPFTNGVGIKTAQIIPTIGNSTYTVQATTPEGCTVTKTITLVVHPQSNVAPSMNGINGNGHYSIYVNQGNPVNFTSTLFNDNTSEVMTIFVNSSQFSGLNYSLTAPGTGGGNLSFSLITNSLTPTGSYSFTLTANDNNGCNALTGTFTFTVIIVCDQCPLCLSYEDRTPANDPLPPETKVGDCIYAGHTATVETGTADVLFQAGHLIDLGPMWSAGPGYQGIIDPNTCVTDCESCCDNWTSFTYDPIQNFMNFGDGDPQTDIWQMTDINHPFCAFGAKGFVLDIFDQSQSSYHSDAFSTTVCCPFQSPSTTNQIPHSSIWWDGWTNNIFGNPVRPYGTLFYTVTLFGCDETIEIQGFLTIINDGNKSAVTNGSNSVVKEEDVNIAVEAFKERQKAENPITISPNPASDHTIIEGLGNKTWMLMVNDDRGNQVINTSISGDSYKIDLSSFASGSYFIILKNGDAVHFDKIVVN